MGGRSGFGKRFREFRRRAQLTQRQLATRLDLDYTYISKIESGAVPPPPRERIEAVAGVFRLSQGEKDELLLLAQEVPADVEQWIVSDPNALVFYRSLAQHSTADQAALLKELIQRLERRHKKGRTSTKD